MSCYGYLERTCAEHIVWNFYATPSARLANKTFQIVSSGERIANESLQYLDSHIFSYLLVALTYSINLFLQSTKAHKICARLYKSFNSTALVILSYPGVFVSIQLEVKTFL